MITYLLPFFLLDLDPNMSLIDRQFLAEALKLNGKEQAAACEFAWGEYLSCDDPVLKYFHVKGVGKLTTPLSVQVCKLYIKK